VNLEAWLAAQLAPAEAAARDALLARGLPDRRDPDWRYTDLRRIAGEGARGAARTRLAAAPAQLRFEPGAPATWSALPAGVSVARVAGGASAAAPGDAFEELNGALGAEALALQVARGVDAALTLFHRGSGDAHPRLRVALEPGARLAVHELHLAEHGLRNSVVALDLARDASLTWVQVQDAGLAARQVASFRAELAAGARLELHSHQLGADVARFAARVRLAGAGAEARLSALSLVEGRRCVDQLLDVAHLATDTVSRQDYRGVADGRGRAAATCRASVAEGAARSDAAQSLGSLLLSPHAEADARPELEILCDDVRCAHGATVGQLDEDALFYLLSRGLPRAEARALLVFAFADAVLAKVDDAALRGAVEALVRDRLPRELVA
jgi:Fe-S cluster assembly protein SufD